MTRRLLLSYVVLTLGVLIALELPLGILNAHNLRQDLRSKVQRDAVTLGSLAEDALEHRRPADANVRAAVRRYAEETDAHVVVRDASGRVVVDSAGARRRRRACARSPRDDARRRERPRLRHRRDHVSDLLDGPPYRPRLVRACDCRCRRARRGRAARPAALPFRLPTFAPGGARGAADRRRRARCACARDRRAGRRSPARAHAERDGGEARDARALAGGLRRGRVAPATDAADGAALAAREPRAGRRAARARDARRCARRGGSPLAARLGAARARAAAGSGGARRRDRRHRPRRGTSGGVGGARGGARPPHRRRPARRHARGREPAGSSRCSTTCSRTRSRRLRPGARSA